MPGEPAINNLGKPKVLQTINHIATSHSANFPEWVNVIKQGLVQGYVFEEAGLVLCGDVFMFRHCYTLINVSMIIYVTISYRPGSQMRDANSLHIPPPGFYYPVELLGFTLGEPQGPIKG